MEVQIAIHMEVADEGVSPHFVWWAEAPSVSGFSAAADHLPDLLVQSREALSEILGTPVTLASVLTAETDSSSGDGVETETAPRDRGVESRRTPGPLVPA